MFLCAVGRPWFDPVTKECTFTARASKYRPKGTIEIKSVDVDRTTYFNMLCDELIHAFLHRSPDATYRSYLSSAR